MKKIPLSQGLFAMVDDEDFDYLNQWKWSAYKREKTFYATRAVYLESGKRSSIAMHRQILGASGYHAKCDHFNGNGLDNQKSNLRICKNCENIRNRGIQKNNSSGFKGVKCRKGRNKWVAQIGVDFKTIHIGCFSTPKDAAIAYNKAAKKYHGEFAKLNDIQVESETM